jgi:hypothetical protein
MVRGMWHDEKLAVAMTFVYAAAFDAAGAVHLVGRTGGGIGTATNAGGAWSEGTMWKSDAAFGSGIYWTQLRIDADGGLHFAFSWDTTASSARAMRMALIDPC